MSVLGSTALAIAITFVTLAFLFIYLFIYLFIHLFIIIFFLMDINGSAFQ